MDPEYTIRKLLCPEGHEVSFVVHDTYACETCRVEYGYEELQKIPVVSQAWNNPANRPTVYGKPN